MVLPLFLEKADLNIQQLHQDTKFEHHQQTQHKQQLLPNLEQPNLDHQAVLHITHYKQPKCLPMPLKSL